jgi:hypothetical protein
VASSRTQRSDGFGGLCGMGAWLCWWCDCTSGAAWRVRRRWGRGGVARSSKEAWCGGENGGGGLGTEMSTGLHRRFIRKVLGFEGEQCTVDGGDSRLSCCRHATRIRRLWFRR